MAKSDIRHLNIYIDGGARGNPGPAGIGVVLSDISGRIVKRTAKYIGKTTNNVAEYKALIVGLKQARNLNVEEIVINTDSELLARQLAGEYKVKSEALKELYIEIMQSLEWFAEVRVNKILREENKEADKLVNKAIDSMTKKKVGRSFVLKTKNTR